MRTLLSLFLAFCFVYAFALAADSDHAIEGMPDLGGEGALSFSLGILGSLFLINVLNWSVVRRYLTFDEWHVRSPEESRIGNTNAWLTGFFIINAMRIPSDGSDTPTHTLFKVLGIMLGILWLIPSLPRPNPDR